MSDTKFSNREIARVLDGIAELLDVQNANPFRVLAYRNAAQVVRMYEGSIAELVRRGDMEVLQALPQIGKGTSAVIAEYVREGRSRVLEQLQGEVGPAGLFAAVPGIGKTLAQRIVRELEIDNLEELERAANDGRLARVEGFGDKRIETVRAGLNEMLSRPARRRRTRRNGANGNSGDTDQVRPKVGLLLEIDAEYRRRAQANELAKIAPRRFNPTHEAWLPIWHTAREGWEFTAMYSNTAQAHELGKTRDWVVIYYAHNGDEEQVTVVTPASGKLKGKRVVRGREVESARYYENENLLKSGG